tara:strand:- start:1950 stop:2816 length:867 start_codon:yes stop_codon:yes gene_type:complete
MITKGIILSGGSGTRMYPTTAAVSKQFLPIFDKPMIYYPLTTLIQSGIRDILIICTQNDIDLFKRLLGSGSQWGLNFSYEIQKNPNGIAEAFIIGEKFISGQKVALILGDNIIYGATIQTMLSDLASNHKGASIFGYEVSDPERYGVAGFDDNGILTSIEEKPLRPKSNFAITGLYFYESEVVEIAKGLKPSKRGELEITDINNIFLKNNKLHFHRFYPGSAWLDAGTSESLLSASEFISTLQDRQGILIGSPELAALENGWISKEDIKNFFGSNIKSNYTMQILRRI